MKKEKGKKESRLQFTMVCKAETTSLEEMTADTRRRFLHPAAAGYKWKVFRYKRNGQIEIVQES